MRPIFVDVSLYSLQYELLLFFSSLYNFFLSNILENKGLP